MAEPSERDPGNPDDESATVSVVRLPRRRVANLPVPWSIRRGGDDAPQRRWTPVGTVDSGELAAVDPAGLINLNGRTWSLDWWIRAEDRWHHPSMEATTSQHPRDATPVLCTEVRVPGGLVTSTTGAARVTAGGWTGDAVVSEVHNNSAVPVALALVLRPYRLDAPGKLEQVELLPRESRDRGHGGGSAGAQVAVRVDGTEIIVLDRMPARVAHGRSSEVLAALASGSDEPVDEASMGTHGHRWVGNGRHGFELAFVFPVAHTATVGVTIVPGTPQRARRWFRGRRDPVEPGVPARVPELSSVTAGWDIHCSGDPTLTWVVDTAESFLRWSGLLLRVAAPGLVTRCLDPSDPGSRGGGAKLAEVTRAVASLPCSELHDAIAAALVRAQRFSGRVEPTSGEDATIALLSIAAVVMRGELGAGRGEELVGPVAKAIAHLESTIGSPGAVAETSGGGAATGDRAVARALRQVAAGLVGCGQPEVAEHALDTAARAEAALGSSEPAPPGRVSLLTPVVAQDPARALVADLSGAVPGSHDDVVATPGTGFDPVALARLRNRVLDAVLEDVAAGPSVLPMWHQEWDGRDVELHRLPTAWGLASVALRWHGAGAALLWDIVPWVGGVDSASAPVVTAPGIAAGWSSAAWKGEALLDPHR